VISVLMPSRMRYELAKESILSLGDGGYEVLMYIDEDDPDKEHYLDFSGLMGLPVRTFIKPRVGYHKFHEMINFLAEQAKGEWLMLWNDDALIECEDWVGKVSSAEKGLTVLNITNPGVDNNNLFPVISRELYELIGHFSLSTHCDSWVQDLANECGVHQSLNGTHIEHRRDRVNDEVKNETQGAYKTTSPEYSSPGMQELWRIDVAKVEEKLNG